MKNLNIFEDLCGEIVFMVRGKDQISVNQNIFQHRIPKQLNSLFFYKSTYEFTHFNNFYKPTCKACNLSTPLLSPPNRNPNCLTYSSVASGESNTPLLPRSRLEVKDESEEESITRENRVDGMA